MTFDARQGTAKGGKSDLWFGAGVFVCASVIFSAIMSLPETPEHLTVYADVESATSSVIPAIASAQTLPPAKLDQDIKTYIENIEMIDMAAGEALATRLIALPDIDQSREVMAVSEGLHILQHQSDVLVRLPVTEIDGLLDMTRDGLWKAARDQSPLCQGSDYSHLLQAEGLTAASLSKELNRLAPSLTGYGMTAISFLTERVPVAAAAPEYHGEITRVDRAALEGVLMSIASDEQIVPILIAQQTGRTTDEALEDLNVCELGATAVTALKTLPQDTKGRVFRHVLETLPKVDNDVAGLIATMRL